MSKSTLRVSIIVTAAFALTVALILGIYLKFIPWCVSNEDIISSIEKIAEKQIQADIEIQKPRLETSIRPRIGFSLDGLSITKNNKKILDIKNFDTNISYPRILVKKVVINKLGADYIYADVNKLVSLVQPQSETKEQKPLDWHIDLFNSLLYIKNCIIDYEFTKNTRVKFNGKNLEITAERNPKHVHFDIDLDIINDNKTLSFNIKDENKVYTKNHKLFADKCTLLVNNSKMYIDAELGEKSIYANVNAKKFNVANVVELIRSNFIIPNGDEMLSYFKNISGNFDFNIELTNSGMKGFVSLNGGKLTLVPLNDLVLNIQSGHVDITPNEITLSNIKGYYNKDKANTVDIKGYIRDYLKSFDTNIIITANTTKDFSNNHLSKVVGYPLEIVGNAKSIIVYKSLYNDINVGCLFMLKKGSDILVDGMSLSPINYDRVATINMDFNKDDIVIKSIDYYIGSEINRESKIKPILTLWGKLDAKSGMPKNFGFKIPKPLPSEFLNVLIGQKVFKKGQIAGYLEYIAQGKTPYIKADMSMDKVAIPAQRMFIKHAKFSADNGLIKLTSDGRFKRSSYSLAGTMLNEIKLPVVIKDVNLTLDNLDIERIMQSMNAQNNQNNTQKSGEILVSSTPGEDENDDTDSAPVFDAGLLIVENCVFNLIKGKYKDVNFGNLKAVLTLDKNGLLKVNSNRFDIAEGISSCKVECDLKNHKYALVLGAKEINSDIMATSILGLSREISGKASGIISLNTDKSLALNGFIKFVVKNGQIGKVGLIEYVLKFAALFRNPIAMISPSTFVDLVNIPEGNFDKIEGNLELKSNVIEKIVIKSSSPQLSSLIVGKFDLVTRDAILRIYTRFSSKNKGIGGFLRNISLNSLANRVPLSSRNDSAYYAAELKHLPPIEADERDCQIFLTKVDGDVEHFNFISSLKKIK